MNRTAMNPPRSSLKCAIATAVCFAFAARGALAIGPVVSLERISVATDGTQGNGESSRSVISSDGRIVAFQSYAYNLVPGFSAGAPGAVFVRDRVSGSTELVSGGLDGAPALGSAFAPAISADGRYVAFNSTSSNLVAGGTNGLVQIFVRDRLLGKTILASINDGGTDAAGGGQSSFDNYIPNWISGDGRYVVFHGYQKLTPNASNDHVHLYRRDLVASKTELVDVNPAGDNANGDSDGGSISADGRYILFVSYSGDIVTGANPYGLAGLYLRDMVLGTTVSITPNVTLGGLCQDGSSGDPAAYQLSGNAKFATFYSNCGDISASQTAQDHVFVRDLTLGVTSPLRLNDDGTPGGGGIFLSVSNSGRYVIGWSQATTIVPGATNQGDIYLRDRSSARTYRISERVDNGASANGDSGWAMASGGGHIAFTSYASNLVDGDSNGYGDVFVATLDALFASGFE
jgi:WD40-like Beta Propeller Repeat